MPSSRGIGFSAVPRTSFTRSVTVFASTVLTSNAGAARHETFEFFVAHELDLAPVPERCRVGHPRFVVRGLERHRLVHQHHGHHVLETDIRDFAVVDDLRFVRRHGDDDALHLVGFEAVLLDQDLERVERRLIGEPVVHF
jgi:hypothetical protein